jgi:hypothetical protein
MALTRVYVPSSWAGLRALVTNSGIGPAPFLGHAVTEALRGVYPDGGEEEWEYAAMVAAARSSLGLIGEGDPSRRVVVALDADTVAPGGDADPTVVEVGEVVPYRRLAAVLVDAPDAAADVAAARSRWAAAEAGDAEAEAVIDRCLDRELAWYGVQEIGELLQD